MSYRVTVRRGPKVTREVFETLNQAVAAAERHTQAAPARAPVDAIGRRYEPKDLVAARVEIRGPTGRAGLDVRGDGAIVAYTGRVRRRHLDGDDPLAALRAALTA